MIEEAAIGVGRERDAIARHALGGDLLCDAELVDVVALADRVDECEAPVDGTSSARLPLRRIELGYRLAEVEVEVDLVAVDLRGDELPRIPDRSKTQLNQ